MKPILLSACLFLTLLAHAQQADTVSVYFDFDRFDLGADAVRTLDSVSGQLIKEKREVELRGHCDEKGSDAYNERLSQNRVEAVRRFFISRGLSTSFLSKSIGYGERNPVADNSTDEGRALNRRVEIIIPRGGDTGVTELKKQLADSTKLGTTIALRNINFEGGRSIFLEDSYPALQELLAAMETYPSLVIRVEGHICCQPDDRDGIDMGTGYSNLSEARARAVKDYLVENGIASSRVGFIGFGHSRPLHPYPERTEEERKENRRVEIRIMSR